MRYVITCLLLFIVGCGDKKWAPETFIEPDFVTYTDEFNEDLQAYGLPELKNIRVEYGPTPLYAIGVCKKWGDKETTQRAVWIDRDLWSRAGDWIRRITIYHELGHCVLDRDHTEVEIESIMSPSLNFELEFYRDNWDIFLEELFS